MQFCQIQSEQGRHIPTFFSAWYLVCCILEFVWDKSKLPTSISSKYNTLAGIIDLFKVYNFRWNKWCATICKEKGFELSKNNPTQPKEECWCAKCWDRWRLLRSSISTQQTFKTNRSGETRHTEKTSNFH